MSLAVDRSAFPAWWDSRTTRERRMLGLLGALILLLGFWYGIASPIRAAERRAAEEHARAVERLTTVTAAAGEVAALRTARGASDNRPLAAVITQSALAAGVPITGQALQGDGLAVSVERSDPAAFFRWAAMLGRDHGVSVGALEMSRNPDNTLRARIVFNGGGGMTALRRGLLFAGALLVLLVVFTPLRWVLERLGTERQGLAAAEVRGTVWAGQLVGASRRGLPLGDAQVGLRPLPLLIGRTRLVIETGVGGPNPGRAVLVRSGAVSGISDATVTLPVQLLNTPLPLRGEVRLVGVSALFREGRCLTAEGRLATDLLQRSAEFLQWQGPELTGSLTCQNGSLSAPLSGARDGTQIRAGLQLRPGGAYRLDTRVLTSDLTLGTALALAGFQRGAEGLTRIDNGRLGS